MMNTTGALRACLFASVALSVSCGGSNPYVETIQNRAKFDLSCQADQLEIQDLGSDTYGVTGCNKKATYICMCMNHFFGACMKPFCSMDVAQNPPAKKVE